MPGNESQTCPADAPFCLSRTLGQSRLKTLSATHDRPTDRPIDSLYPRLSLHLSRPTHISAPERALLPSVVHHLDCPSFHRTDGLAAYLLACREDATQSTDCEAAFQLWANRLANPRAGRSPLSGLESRRRFTRATVV
ncbi:unnamed protein product [Protopolystoma xenopodis]|uniref:Uncharacterized protein n=1 Tax=Protopolystoma xenopodis TaxID=117903 RepID=A0A3S5AHJ6_9PLAT|nr:unnamed protein product [Protopolystoma xenopodis]